MITRTQAKNYLRKLIDSNALSPEITIALMDIVTCLDAEVMGYLIWGADNDYTALFESYPVDKMTEGLRGRQDKIKNKYRYEPSRHELAHTE